MSRRLPTPEICPVCGAPVRPGARACAECGADERSGWDDAKTRYDGLDLPDEAYDDTEAPPASSAKPRSGPGGLSRTWWLVGVVMLLVFAFLVVSSRF